MMALKEGAIDASIRNKLERGWRTVDQFVDGCCNSASNFQYIVTPNVDHCRLLAADESFFRAYLTADKAVCDSRVLAALLPERRHFGILVCPGSDLAKLLLSRAPFGARVVTIGPSKSDAKKLGRLYPDLRIVSFEPSRQDLADTAWIQRLAESLTRLSPNLILIGLGAPRQEILASQLKALGVPTGLALCCGAAIDFLTGSQRRAPIWMQRLTLEWLHRLCSNPSRLLGRYSKDAIWLLGNVGIASKSYD